MNEKQEKALKYAAGIVKEYNYARGMHGYILRKIIRDLEKGEREAIDHAIEILEYERSWDHERIEIIDRCIIRLESIL